MKQKGFGVIYILVGIVIIVAIAGGAFYLGQKTARNTQPQNSPNQKACTEEAKICPDGSAVGRVGPNCEFVECPAEKVDETANWKSFEIKNVNLSFKYPDNWDLLETKYDDIDQEIKLNGSEGNISIKIGTGFGGGCPVMIMVNVKDQELQGCKTEDGKRISFGKETNIDVDLDKGTISKLSIDVDADINDPIQTNQDVILKILSTFKFLK